MKRNYLKENSMKYVFLISSLFSIIAIMIICFYIFF